MLSERKKSKSISIVYYNCKKDVTFAVFTPAVLSLPQELLRLLDPHPHCHHLNNDCRRVELQMGLCDLIHHLCDLVCLHWSADHFDDHFCMHVQKRKGTAGGDVPVERPASRIGRSLLSDSNQ